MEDTEGGGQWRDWQRGMEDTEWRPVEGLAERDGGHGVEANGGIGREGWRTLSGGQRRDWQKGMEDTKWRPVEGLAERGGGH
ncbi:unnamed protein product [Staurois parvus]|uniref:Uncharacterized protein n=1 Tax=Staurois parvus TaxID=386267 RepID=A0ABN9ALP4_9NEOB|nr:unnamed protein product [Staurois parvus]